MRKEPPYREGYVLNDNGIDLLSQFLRTTLGCTCFSSAPCGSCMCAGSPANLQENDLVWRKLSEQEIRARRVKRKIEL